MKRFFKFFGKISSHWLSAMFSVIAITSVIGVFFIFFYGSDLPDYMQLARYEPPITTRIYAADGKLMEEYAKEKRIFVPIKDIPKPLIQAFLAAEDRNFYQHQGVDFLSIIRAIVQNAANVMHGKSLIGGSTITQQVAKNFLLTNERSLNRKVKEAILAIRMSAAFSKDKILELYLNEIYLGRSSYGVAAAAVNYFNKSVDELNLEEAALLAAMPKAPSSYDPEKNYEKALARRNWVIKGMQEMGYIRPAEAELAIKSPIIIRKKDKTEVAQADFFAEEVRRVLEKDYGDKVLYEGGLYVRTTMDPDLQLYAERALRHGLILYDMRRGYRGPVTKISTEGAWEKTLEKVPPPKAIGDFLMAVVLGIKSGRIDIGFINGVKAVIPAEGYEWTGKKASSLLKKGDVVLVERITDSSYQLRQVPAVEGGIVAMDPHTGRILAMVGGYSYKSSQFNRVSQALRQPGSAFKPFVYLVAMENGFTPSTIVDDAPIELDQGEGLPKWSPQNYSEEYYGPSTLRVGLENSRNVMSVRLSVMLGLDKAVEAAKRFGINDNPRALFSTVLGSLETTLLNITNAYCMLVNGGKETVPYFIEKIQDRTGSTIFRNDKRECKACKIDSILQLTIPSPPDIPNTSRQVTDERSAFQVVSMLEGVVQRGTGTKAREIGKVVAGKTGTTNESRDSWFIGFSPDLVVGVFVGYDKPESLGEKESGATVAVPIFVEFMQEALKDKPSTPFRIPQGIKMVRVDHKTGLLPGESTPPGQIIYEAFKTENIPNKISTPPVKEEGAEQPQDKDSTTLGTGGIY